jgi:hypothetical protein
MADRIADDMSSIAARLKELEKETAERIQRNSEATGGAGNVPTTPSKSAEVREPGHYTPY